MLNTLRNLYLLVAGDCNLRCDYCYADGGGFGGSPAPMARETLAVALDKLVPRHRPLVISFMGGEPLLDLDLLQEAVSRGNALATQRESSLRYVLTTNGTLLDAPRVAFLKAHISHVAVSLDGPPALTDASRRFKTGKASVYETVVQNLQRLQEAGIPYGLRGTIPESQADTLGAAFAHLSTLGARAVRIDAAAGANAWQGPGLRRWTREVCTLNEQAMHRLLAGEATRLSPQRLSDLLPVAAHRLGGVSRQYPCAAGQGILAVSTTGEVYPCDHFVGMAGFSLGNVRDGDFPGVAAQQVVARLVGNRVDARPRCQHCPVRQVCGGECPARSQLRQGNLAEPSPSHCAVTRPVLQHANALLDEALASPPGRERIAHMLGCPPTAIAPAPTPASITP